MSGHDNEAGRPLLSSPKEEGAKPTITSHTTSAPISPAVTSAETVHHDKRSPTITTDSPISPKTRPNQVSFSPELPILELKEPAICEVSGADTITLTSQQAEEPFGPTEEHNPPNFDYHGIWWRSPTLMGLSWIFGVVFSFAHHLFYSHFDGLIVGSANEQQWNIRFVV
jgi:hypothetical protein